MYKISHAQYVQTGEKWDSLSATAKDIIKGLLCVDHEKRLSAKGALDHEWFQEISTEKTQISCKQVNDEY